MASRLLEQLRLQDAALIRVRKNVAVQQRKPGSCTTQDRHHQAKHFS